MTFDPERLLKEPPIETIAEHNLRDVILYALGVGVGVEAATSMDTLRFAYEQDIQVLPTMAAVLATPGFWAKDPRYGIDWKRILHGEQSLTCPWRMASDHVYHRRPLSTDWPFPSA